VLKPKFYSSVIVDASPPTCTIACKPVDNEPMPYRCSDCTVMCVPPELRFVLPVAPALTLSYLFSSRIRDSREGYHLTVRPHRSNSGACIVVLLLTSFRTHTHTHTLAQSYKFDVVAWKWSQ
jgi:hypothetical protein